MVNPWNCSLHRFLAVMCIVLHGIWKTSVAYFNSCEVSRSTVQIVEDCPVSAEKWSEAAKGKRCDIYAKRCSEPDRLVYHCVINPYVNHTIEVCAYAQNIVQGRCTSYDIIGNVIQENWNADCSEFKENACPVYYRSDTAYNYPGCYNLTKKLTSGTSKPLSTSPPDTTVVPATPSSNMFTYIHVDMPGKEEKMDNYTGTIIAIIVVVLFAVTATIIFILFVFRKRNQRDYRRKPLEIAKTGVTMPKRKHPVETSESICTKAKHKPQAEPIDYQRLAQEIVKLQKPNSDASSSTVVPLENAASATYANTVNGLPAPTTASSSMQDNHILSVVSQLLENIGEPVGTNKGFFNCDNLISVTEGIPLDVTIPQKIKAKIWSNEFFDLRVLLSHQDEEPLTLCITPGVINVQNSLKSKTPMFISQWTDAFLNTHQKLPIY